MMRWTKPFGALVCALAVALTMTAAPAPAQAAPTAFKDKPVVVLVRGASNDENLYIWGLCTDVDEHGVWLDQTHIQYMPNGVTKRKARIYVPMSSVTFIKFDQG